MVSTQEDAQELACVMEDEENPMDRGARQASSWGQKRARRDLTTKQQTTKLSY